MPILDILKVRVELTINMSDDFINKLYGITDEEESRMKEDFERGYDDYCKRMFHDQVPCEKCGSLVNWSRPNGPNWEWICMGCCWDQIDITRAQFEKRQQGLCPQEVFDNSPWLLN